MLTGISIKMSISTEKYMNKDYKEFSSSCHVLKSSEF